MLMEGFEFIGNLSAITDAIANNFLNTGMACKPSCN